MDHKQIIHEIEKQPISQQIDIIERVLEIIRKETVKNTGISDSSTKLPGNYNSDIYEKIPKRKVGRILNGLRREDIYDNER